MGKKLQIGLNINNKLSFNHFTGNSSEHDAECGLSNDDDTIPKDEKPLLQNSTKVR